MTNKIMVIDNWKEHFEDMLAALQYAGKTIEQAEQYFKNRAKNSLFIIYALSKEGGIK